MKNALTFDIEEYFHAEVFARALSPEDWPSLASRVVDTTERLLDILDYADVRATFFVLGWIADRYPTLVQDIAGGIVVTRDIQVGNGIEFICDSRDLILHSMLSDEVATVR